MFRDTLILLILREFLNDINICFYIKDKIDTLEEIDSHIIHYELSKSYCQDIKLLYTGFFKTALFENIKFDYQDNLEPGYSYYSIKPLTPCGNLVDWNLIPPTKLSLIKYMKEYKYKRNGIYLINAVRKNYPEKFINRLVQKRNRYAHYDLLYSNYYDSSISLWFDYEQLKIINFN